MKRISFLLLALLVSCSELERELPELNRSDLSDSINYDHSIEQIKLNKIVRAYKMDSISQLAKEITRLNTMKEVNMLNHFEKVKDSLVNELEIEHAIVHELMETPKDSIIFDTVYEYITVYDTVKIYDTITVKYSKFNKKRVKK